MGSNQEMHLPSPARCLPPTFFHTPHHPPPAAALQQPQQGQNLAFLAAGNYLRSLGIEQQSEITRILVSWRAEELELMSSGGPRSRWEGGDEAQCRCGYPFKWALQTHFLPTTQDIAMNPNSLYTSRDRKQPTNPYARRLEVEADMTPVVDFLLGQGLSREQVAKVGGYGWDVWVGECLRHERACLRDQVSLLLLLLLQAIALHPALLCYSVPDRLAPFFEYLAGPQLEMSAAEAATVVERRPTILGVQVRAVPVAEGCWDGAAAHSRPLCSTALL